MRGAMFYYNPQVEDALELVCTCALLQSRQDPYLFLRGREALLVQVCSRTMLKIFHLHLSEMGLCRILALKQASRATQMMGPLTLQTHSQRLP